MKKILFTLLLLVMTIPLFGQRYVGYQRWGKYTDAQMNAIDTSNSNEVYQVYNATQGKWKCNTGSGWVDCDQGGGSATTDASLLTSGVLADGRVQQSNVTQHQAALIISESQISDLNHTPAADGSETKINAGTNVNITGSGTIGDPYIVNSTGGSGSTNLAYDAPSRTVSSDTGTDAVLPLATTSNPGLLPSSDKQKIDDLTISNPVDLDGLVITVNSKENLLNKVTDLSDPNNTEYPTTLAVANAVTPQELTQAEFDALTTAEKKALGLYVIVPPAPSGYTVTIDNDPVLADGSDSFTWAGAEVGSFYDYSFTSSGGGTPVTGFGEIATATDQITDIDLSGLPDGTITLTAYLWNAGGDGANATDTAEKAAAIVDLFPTGNAASIGAGEANSTTGWVPNGASCVITSVANTDVGGGGSYAISLEQLNTGFRSGAITVTGLNLTPHTATFRTRRVSGTGGVFNWTNVTAATYNVNYDANGTDWFEATVTFTPTTGSVNLQFYPGDNDGTPTGVIEISEIVITEN